MVGIWIGSLRLSISRVVILEIKFKVMGGKASKRSTAYASCPQLCLR